MLACTEPVDGGVSARGDGRALPHGGTAVVRLYRVEDVVRLVRLVPLGEDDLVDEADAVDSVTPAYTGQAYLLLRAAGGPFASVADAARAFGDSRVAGGGDAPRHGELWCRPLHGLDRALTAVWPNGRPPAAS